MIIHRAIDGFYQTLTQFDRFGQPKVNIMDIRTELIRAVFGQYLGK